MNNFENTLINGAEKLGMEIKPTQVQQFKIYADYLLDYNKHTNLTSITEPSSIAIKHFLDSLLLSKVMGNFEIKMIDIGTGAGFPGMPIKIAHPETEITLVDSLNKRISFLNGLSQKLNLKVNIFHKRAEELSKNKAYRDNFDVSVSRAVASLNILSEYCMPFVRKNGLFIAMKGPQPEEEIKNAKNAVTALGGRVEKIEKLELPDGNGSRSIIVIRKISPTPEEYPRQSAKIIKKPL